MSVDFITFCCPKDIERLHAPGVLESIVVSHQYQFDEVIVVHQRCRGLVYLPWEAKDYRDVVIGQQYRKMKYPFGSYVRIVESEDYPDILTQFGVPEEDPIADEITHGPAGPHYWKYHVINHLIGLKESTAAYIAFSDCDCYIKSTPARSWIEEGIDILQRYREVLIISPGDGGHMFEESRPEARLTQNVSQQLFLCERERLLDVDFNMEWDGKMNCVGGPFPEFYFLLEGRLWRWMNKWGLWRAVLPDRWRYWHRGWH